MTWNGNVSRNGNAAEIVYESDFSRVSRSGDVEREAKRMEKSEAALDSQSRPHITRKLRNRLGTSPPPTPLASHPNGIPNTAGPTSPELIINPHSLSVGELPSESPFPLPLTATSLPNTATGNSGGNGGWRRPKGGGFQVQAVGGLGKSGAILTGCKETKVDSDLGEIRRGNKTTKGWRSCDKNVSI